MSFCTRHGFCIDPVLRWDHARKLHVCCRRKQLLNHVLAHHFPSLVPISRLIEIPLAVSCLLAASVILLLPFLVSCHLRASPPPSFRPIISDGNVRKALMITPSPIGFISSIIRDGDVISECWLRTVPLPLPPSLTDWVGQCTHSAKILWQQHRLAPTILPNAALYEPSSFLPFPRTFIHRDGRLALYEVS